MLLRAVIILILSGVVSTSAIAKGITIFAAASLTDALDDIAQFYSKKSDKKVIISYAASSALARQIENGAGAHIFISADETWMNYLQNRQKLVAGSSRALLGNQLVVIQPQSISAITLDSTNMKSWQQALQGGLLAVGDPDHVPVGIYTKQALQHLLVWDTLKNKLARADNVRSALRLVERKETTLGVVYASDIVNNMKVKQVTLLPESSHTPIIYPIAQIAGQEDPDAVQFYNYLFSDEAKKRFEHFGFSVVS